jgi:hypothetical protein
MISRDRVMKAIDDASKQCKSRAQQLTIIDVVARIAALPADDRRCENCNAWGRGGVCQMVFPAVRWVHAPTKADFYCAAWSPKEDANA